MGRLGNTLWCAADDSNHKGKAGYEINLAAFSFSPKDGKYDDFRNRKNCRSGERAKIYEDARKWMRDTARDYRFAALSRERAVMSSNISWVLPTLIKKYLEHCRHEPETLQIFIDGRVGGDERADIKRNLSGLFLKVGICSVIKGRVGKGRRHPRILHCPKILWAADIWANMMYQEGDRANLNHPKRVIIP